MRTSIVTDSSAWYGVGPAAGVSVVGVGITLPNADDVDAAIGAERVRAALAADEPVKTRAPSVMDYLTAIDGADADAVVVLTPAASLTAMWAHACAAVYLSDRPAVVVDTGTAAAAQRLVVEVAAGAAGAGASLSEVVRVAEQAARRAELLAVLGSVEPIERAGILPSPRDRGPRPMFRFAAGVIEPVPVPPGVGAPAEVLAEAWRRAGGEGGEPPVVFSSGGAPGAAARLVAAVRGAGPVEVSPAVIAYTGPDLLGLAWLAPPRRPG